MYNVRQKGAGRANELAQNALVEAEAFCILQEQARRGPRPMREVSGAVLGEYEGANQVLP